jgi:hypothetical protein
MGLVAFVDGQLLGTAHDITHGNGAPKTLTLLPPQTAAVPLLERALANGGGTLTILAEELGYANYGFTHQILKGIAPQADAVRVGGKPLSGPWTMRGGLAGEHLKVYDDLPCEGSCTLDCTQFGSRCKRWVTVDGSAAASNRSATWFKTTFVTPQPDAIGERQVLLNVDGLQRGRAWLNGHEVGRYWTLQRNNGEACPFGASSCPTQQFYHLPSEWLRPAPVAPGGRHPVNYWNTLVIFEAVGALKLDKVGLAVAAMKPGAGPGVDVRQIASCEF